MDRNTRFINNTNFLSLAWQETLHLAGQPDISFCVHSSMVSVPCMVSSYGLV